MIMVLMYTPRQITLPLKVDFLSLISGLSMASMIFKIDEGHHEQEENSKSQPHGGQAGLNGCLNKTPKREPNQRAREAWAE